MAAAGARSRSRSPRTGVALEGLETVVVNLDRRPDRWERVEKMLSEQAPFLKVSRFSASDGSKMEIPESEIAMTWNTKHNALYGDYDEEKFTDPGVVYKMSGGERGCAHSHYRIWKMAAERTEPLFVVEDDATFDFDRTGDNGKFSGKLFRERFEGALREVPRDIDVLYLGWSGHREGNFKHMDWTAQKETKFIKKAEYVWTTIAYVLWPAGARKLLDAAQPMNQPVDNFMAWENREGRINSYVVVDDGDGDDEWAGGIVDQLDFFGDSDIQKSDGGDQGDDTKALLAEKEESKENLENTVTA